MDIRDAGATILSAREARRIDMKPDILKTPPGSVTVLRGAGCPGPLCYEVRTHTIPAGDGRSYRTFPCTRTEGHECAGCVGGVTFVQKSMVPVYRWSGSKARWIPSIWYPTMQEALTLDELLRNPQRAPVLILTRLPVNPRGNSHSTLALASTVTEAWGSWEDDGANDALFAQWIKDLTNPVDLGRAAFFMSPAMCLSYETVSEVLLTVDRATILTNDATHHLGWAPHRDGRPVDSITDWDTARKRAEASIRRSPRTSDMRIVRYIEVKDGFVAMMA